MPVTLVKTNWASGNLEFLDKSGNIIFTIDGTNRKITVPSGSKIDVSAATGLLLLAAGEIVAADLATDSVETAKVKALAITEAKLALASLTGLVAKVVADVNVIGGLPVYHRITIADAASGNLEVTLTHKTRVIDAWCVKTGADGHATEDTIVVGNGANAITNAMAIGANNDKSITRAATIDDANHEIAAAGKLRITWVKGAGGGNNVACEVYVRGLRVA